MEAPLDETIKNCIRRSKDGDGIEAEIERLLKGNTYAFLRLGYRQNTINGRKKSGSHSQKSLNRCHSTSKKGITCSIGQSEKWGSCKLHTTFRFFSFIVRKAVHHIPGASASALDEDTGKIARCKLNICHGRIVLVLRVAKFAHLFS